MTPDFMEKMTGYFERMEKFLEVGNLASKYSLTLKEASSYTGLGVRKLRQSVIMGELGASKPKKVILIRRVDLEKYIDGHNLKIPKVRRVA